VAGDFFGQKEFDDEIPELISGSIKGKLYLLIFPFSFFFFEFDIM